MSYAWPVNRCGQRDYLTPKGCCSFCYPFEPFVKVIDLLGCKVHILCVAYMCPCCKVKVTLFLILVVVLRIVINVRQPWHGAFGSNLLSRPRLTELVVPLSCTSLEVPLGLSDSILSGLFSSSGMKHST